MRHGIVLIGALLAVPASAAVDFAADSGFELSSKVTVPATPAASWAMLVAPARWWDAKHSWSGSAANLSIEPRAGGCFCEAMPDRGQIEHARVIAWLPGKLLRLSGALGPMQEHGLAGTLSFALKPVPQGTEIVMSYAVGGYLPGGMKLLAPLVDRVNRSQLDRLAAALSPRR